MGNMLSAEVTVEGIRPLLWHAFGPDAIPLEKQEKTGVSGNDPEEWKRTVLLTPDRQLYLRPSYAFGALRDGARHVKVGRGNLVSTLSSTLQIADTIILVDRVLPPDGEIPTDPNCPTYLDIAGVRNPATKGRNVRYRIAAAPGWHATFHAIWDKVVVSRQQFDDVLYAAGMYCGFGDGRSIGNGRFTVTSCEIADLRD